MGGSGQGSIIYGSILDGQNPTGDSQYVLTKKVFYGLAGLLVVTLCFLLVELNSPGVASRVASGIFSGSKVSTLSINNRGHNYYSPVPSPFLSPKQSKAQHSFGAMKMDVASGPTSEPTVLTGHQMHFQADGPTSEPTEYKHHVFTHLQADSVPTSEPTEFREKEEASLRMNLEAHAPTHEPTIFDIVGFPHEHEPTNEPTRFTMHEGDGEESREEANAEPTYEPTIFGESSGEPTIFGQSGEPTVYGQSGEPTVYGQSGEPSVYGQSGEPTTYGQSGEPTVFDPSIHGQRTLEPTIFYHDTLGSGEGKEPTNEPTVFFVDHEHHEHRPACSGSNDCEGGFCNFDEGSHGNCENCSDFSSVERCKSDGLPEAGAKACVRRCFEAPTPSPSQPPHLHTWAPTGGGSFAPTSDPTVFPTPEPTAEI